MLEWIFPKRALMDSLRGGVVWIGSKNPHPFNRQFIYLAWGANVKNTLAPHIHSTHGR